MGIERERVLEGERRQSRNPLRGQRVMGIERGVGVM